MHQTQGNIVAFVYDYERLLDTVWQRTSYIARATKTPDQKNDIREKAMSPDDEVLFHDVISMAAGNAYTPLIKYGREVRTAFNINTSRDGLKKISWNFDQHFEISGRFATPESGTGKVIAIDFKKVADTTAVNVKYTIKLVYDYVVRTIVGYDETRHSETIYTVTRNSSDSETYTIANPTFRYSSVDKGLGVESIVDYLDVKVVDIDVEKVTPETIEKGTRVEYTAKNHATYLFEVPFNCNENTVFNEKLARQDRPSIVENYLNKVCYEVKMDHVDYNMVPVIDSALFDALVCEAVLRWCELANPPYMQNALLAQQRSAEALDKAVFNAVPHIHRVHQHFY